MTSLLLSQNWLILFSAFLLSWFGLFIIRKKRQHKTEFTEQLALAALGLVTLSLMEFFAVSMNLWHYVPGDWPLMLWPTYFVAILFGYQLLRALEVIIRKV